jgi:hypothetical protein
MSTSAEPRYSELRFHRSLSEVERLNFKNCLNWTPQVVGWQVAVQIHYVQVPGVASPSGRSEIWLDCYRPDHAYPLLRVVFSSVSLRGTIDWQLFVRKDAEGPALNPHEATQLANGVITEVVRYGAKRGPEASTELIRRRRH